MDSRCEIVVIESGAGMLNVEARPAAGGPAPSIFWYTTGNYAGLHHAARARSRRNTGARRDVSRPGGGSRRRTVTAIQRHDDVAVVIRQFANESVCALAGRDG